MNKKEEVAPGKLVLEVEGLTLTYRSRPKIFKRYEHAVLKDINFNLYAGETLGVVGRNGCGKSSLLKILSGVIAPTSGQVRYDNSVRRGLLALGLGFRPDLNGRDNALLSMMLLGEGKKIAQEKVNEVHKFSELGESFDRPVKTYSAGMRSRLGFSVILNVHLDVLLLDEVLSVGDAHFRKKAEVAIKKKIGGDQAVIMVSHSAGQVKELCGRSIWLEGGIVKAQGDTSDVLHSYQNYYSALSTGQ